MNAGGQHLPTDSSHVDRLGVEGYPEPRVAIEKGQHHLEIRHPVRGSTAIGASEPEQHAPLRGSCPPRPPAPVVVRSTEAIVHQDDVAVPGSAEVNLRARKSQVDRRLERGHRVLGDGHGKPAVPEESIRPRAPGPTRPVEERAPRQSAQTAGGRASSVARDVLLPRAAPARIAKQFIDRSGSRETQSASRRSSAVSVSRPEPRAAIRVWRSAAGRVMVQDFRRASRCFRRACTARSARCCAAWGRETFPTSSSLPVCVYEPRLSDGYDNGPGRLYRPVLWKVKTRTSSCRRRLRLRPAIEVRVPDDN